MQKRPWHNQSSGRGDDVNDWTCWEIVKAIISDQLSNRVSQARDCEKRAVMSRITCIKPHIKNKEGNKDE